MFCNVGIVLNEVQGWVFCNLVIVLTGVQCWLFCNVGTVLTVIGMLGVLKYGYFAHKGCNARCPPMWVLC